MKKCICLWLLLVFTATLYSQTRKTVFVIVDGIPADVIKKLHTPSIDAIARAGGFTQAMVGGEKDGYSQTPTISAVGYNTVLTGTWANKHNVWDNDIADPNYHYKTIFRLLKEQDSTKKIAIYSSWLDNRTKLVGDGMNKTGNFQIDYHYDGLELDTVRFPHDQQRNFMEAIDQAVTDSAASAIRIHGPDLTWVYLEYTDDMGHAYGDSPQFYKAVESMDKKIGQLWTALQYRQKQFGEEWLILITTDHGRDAKTGKDHGGQSDRERRGWIATNAKNLNDHFKKGNASIADIMPTIASFMPINIPREDLMEIDGVSLINKTGSTNLKAIRKNNTIQLQWKKMSTGGDAKIWLSTTNNYKHGGKDNYVLVQTVALSAGKATIDVSKYPSDFYKVVVETPVNYSNTWVINKD